MRTAIAIMMIPALMTVSSCFLSGTKESPHGGVILENEEFSIIVPASNTVAQGAAVTVVVSLNRGAHFKRDVVLDVETDSISVTPTNVLIKASDTPDVQLQIVVAKDAALGEYRVAVRGTPETGKAASTEFMVKVVAQ